MTPIVELLVAWFIVILEGVFTEERKHKSIMDYIPFKSIFEFLIASNGNVWGIICLIVLWVIAFIMDDIIKETS